MKIMKIKEDHYIVVDDSEIKEGDWLLDTTDNTIWDCYKDMSISLFPECKKITHSTQPIEKDEETYTYEKVKYIPLSYIKELIGEVNVSAKANEEYKDNLHNPFFTAAPMGYIKGYNKALEDNKYKKYTEEDLRKALEYGYERGKEGDFTSEQEENFYQSLQPKTEWEVEIVDGKLKLK